MRGKTKQPAETQITESLPLWLIDGTKEHKSFMTEAARAARNFAAPTCPTAAPYVFQQAASLCTELGAAMVEAHDQAYFEDKMTLAELFDINERAAEFRPDPTLTGLPAEQQARYGAGLQADVRRSRRSLMSIAQGEQRLATKLTGLEHAGNRLLNGMGSVFELKWHHRIHIDLVQFPVVDLQAIRIARHGPLTLPWEVLNPLDMGDDTPSFGYNHRKELGS